MREKNLLSPRFLRGWHTWPFLVLLLAAAGQASAATRPSFNLDQSAWDATDIVMAETTTEDDTFQVVESWKGDLRAAQRITIPELRPGAGAVPISQYPMQEGYSDTRTKIPKQIPGSRLVLFLKKRNQEPPSSDAKGQEAHADWEPANLFHDFKTAAVWIEGTLYCFEQIMNPGESVLVEFSWYAWDRTSERTYTPMTIVSTRERVSHVVQLQRQLRTAVQIEDTAGRAEQLKAFARSDVRPARAFVFAELGKAGSSALPVLHAMLDDPAYADLKESVLHAYAQAGGTAAGEELSARLETELEFWKATGPSLARGWWNERSDAALRQRYGETMEIIHGLTAIGPFAALNTAIEFRDFWRSLPQLNDPGGLYKVADECDQLVQHIRSNITSE